MNPNDTPHVVVVHRGGVVAILHGNRAIVMSPEVARAVGKTLMDRADLAERDGKNLSPAEIEKTILELSGGL